MATPPSSQLQSLLQTAVQSVQWTYSVFWQICPQQGSLVWGEGYYNGSIKTRKTLQPMEVNEEDACPLRSQQLRELYDSLIVGETTPTAKRPCAALSPEDLTESEWFYLMCISFSFSPGTGLPGKAYSRRRHVWLTGAGEVDSKVFCRSILAKSAGIQTVLCLPLLGGVVELGTVDKVKEDLGLVQRVKAFFSDSNPHLLQPQKPALSAHSTSGSATSFDLHHTFNSPPLLSSAIADGEEEDNDDVSDSEAETERYGFPDSMAEATVSQPSDIMHMEVDDTRVGSPGDRSENLASDFLLVDVDGQEMQTADDILRSQEEVGDPYRIGIQAQASGTYPLEDQLAMEDDRYSVTVSTILRNQSSRWANSSTAGSTSYPTQSAFSGWAGGDERDHLDTTELEGTSQWVLKYVLFTVPLLHAKQHDENFSTLRFRKGTPQDDFNTNHVLAERRRREKLNERFIILRSLVPFVTKMDKASILGDTIEYVKQLCKKIQDLEACNRRMEADRRSPSSERQNTNSWKLQTSGVTQMDDGGASSYESEKRKMRRVVDGSSGVAMPKTVEAPPPPPLQISREADVQVSIIGSDALLEIQCHHKEGLLLDVMQMLRELLIEITTIQSSSSNGVFVAELKAKVKENSSGRRASIVEVKRALQRIIPHSNT